VNSSLKLYHWLEADDDAEMPDPNEYFWRQTYDITNMTYSVSYVIVSSLFPNIC